MCIRDSYSALHKGKCGHHSATGWNWDTRKESWRNSNVIQVWYLILGTAVVKLSFKHDYFWYFCRMMAQLHPLKKRSLHYRMKQKKKRKSKWWNCHSAAGSSWSLIVCVVWSQNGDSTIALPPQEKKSVSENEKVEGENQSVISSHHYSSSKVCPFYIASFTEWQFTTTTATPKRETS